MLAQVSIALKNWQKVKDLYQDILNDDKKNPVAQINLAWVLAEHFDQPAEALNMMKKKLEGPFSHKEVAVESLPVDFLNVLGQVYEQAVRKKVAKDLQAEMLKVFEPASKRYPSDPRMFLYLGEAHAGMEDKDQANAAYRNAISLAQNGKGPFSQEERKEFIQEGERPFERAVKCTPLAPREGKFLLRSVRSTLKPPSVRSLRGKCASLCQIRRRQWRFARVRIFEFCQGAAGETQVGSEFQRSAIFRQSLRGASLGG